VKKISTLYKKDPNNLGRVINEINPENEWAINHGTATRKYDGTSSAIINGELYKRYDVKKGRAIPPNAIACQEPDEITGHHPHWVKCNVDDMSDQYHFEGFNKLENKVDGTYELCGPKVQGNPENLDAHYLIPHGKTPVAVKVSFDEIKAMLLETNIEGIVFHANDGTGRMCKIRKSDFGIKR
jgi:hypothetical protein